jgi:hypothetical protein
LGPWLEFLHPFYHALGRYYGDSEILSGEMCTSR